MAAVVPIKQPRVTELTRVAEEIAEDIYMDSEKSAAVLRSMIDQLQIKVGEQAAEIQRIHNANNARCKEIDDKVHRMELVQTVLVGLDGKSGLVYSLKTQARRLFEMADEAKTRHWRLLLALGTAGGSGAAIGKFLM